MLFKNITIIDENFEVKRDMNVGVKGDRIVYVSDQPPQEDLGEVYEGKNRLLLPAFYNMHSHLPMFYLRGYAENLPLQTWLQDKIFPFEAHLTGEDMYYGTLMGAAEMLRYGTASATDMYLDQAANARAFAESGIKGNVSQCFMVFDDTSYFEMPLYNETLEAIKQYDGYDDGRLRVEFSLHAEYTSSEKGAKEIARAALENASSMHVHVAETANETAECRIRHEGRSPVKYLADCGIFDVPAVAAHCVHIDDEDIAILKEHNVTVAANPKSNAKLSSGISPVAKLLGAGVNVAIGTDSVSSNNNLNMIEEMRFFNLFQKASVLDPTVITPAQTLYAATRAGALAQGREDCGFIKEGFRADLTVMDIDRIYMKPDHNLLNNLIYSASGNDIVLTMVDGRVLYRDGIFTTIDIERVVYECDARLQRILGQIAGK